MFLDHVGRDITSRTFPAVTRLVKEIDDVKGVGELFLQLVEFLAEKDVLLRDIRVEKLEFGLVVLIAESVGDDLIERRAGGVRVNAWFELGVDDVRLTCHCLLQSRRPRRIR